MTIGDRNVNISLDVQEWRNWQTRRLQVPVVATSCGFKSHLLQYFRHNGCCAFYHKEIQDEVLNEIDEKEYLNVLKPLLKQKRKSIKANSDYELNQKLVRFAYGRGFTFDIIRQCLDVSDIDEDEFEDDED